MFDNDGTLWTEQPIYFQLAFAFDRAKAMAPQHPEWSDREPFRSLLAGDMEAVLASGEKGLGEILAVTHAGMTTEEFAASVSATTVTEKTILAMVMVEVRRFERRLRASSPSRAGWPHGSRAWPQRHAAVSR